MKKFNVDLFKLLISVIFFILSFIFKDISFLLLLISYVIISYSIYIEAIEKIFDKEFFDENLLMILATIGAFVIGESAEAVMVIWLFELGEYLADLAVDRSKDSIFDLMELKKDKISLKRNGMLEEVRIEDVKEGDIFLVKPGEKIGLDGILLEGKSSVDTSFITGESVPRIVSKGDCVFSGYVNLDSILTIKATSTCMTSLSAKIVKLMEEADTRKAKTEKFITRFAKIYTPLIVLFAILLVLIPVLFGQNYEVWLYKALVFLVTSCPCALVLSIPLGYFCGIGKASKEGILIKGGNELETLSKVTKIALDKTGTLTEGVFEVTEIVTSLEKKEFLKLFSSCELYSNHPIAKSILRSYSGEIEKEQIQNYKEIPGKGVSCFINGDAYYAGNKELFSSMGMNVPDVSHLGSIVYLGRNQEYLGYVIVSDKVKMDAKDFISSLKIKPVLLSGDTVENVASLAGNLGIKEYYASLLPTDKVKIVENLKKEDIVLFVGDGMNDAPVMKKSDVSISMGKAGSDLAIESSDIVLLRDRLSDIKKVIEISKRTMSIIHFNIFFALFMKFFMLILGLFGFTSIWMAVIADVGVTLISVLNTLRLFFKK